MGKQLSFTKYERETLPQLRENLNMAESTEDVKKFFFYTCKELFGRIFADQEVTVNYDDIVFDPQRAPFYQISDRLHSLKPFSVTWNSSDLSRLLSNMATTAKNRFIRLEKHFDKTEAKIRG
jgi:hypothetical protein